MGTINLNIPWRSQRKAREAAEQREMDRWYEQQALESPTFPESATPETQAMWGVRQQQLGAQQIAADEAMRDEMMLKAAQAEALEMGRPIIGTAIGTQFEPSQDEWSLDPNPDFAGGPSVPALQPGERYVREPAGGLTNQMYSALVAEASQPQMVNVPGLSQQVPPDVALKIAIADRTAKQRHDWDMDKARQKHDWDVEKAGEKQPGARSVGEATGANKIIKDRMFGHEDAIQKLVEDPQFGAFKADMDSMMRVGDDPQAAFDMALEMNPLALIPEKVQDDFYSIGGQAYQEDFGDDTPKEGPEVIEDIEDKLSDMGYPGGLMNKIAKAYYEYIMKNPRVEKGKDVPIGY